MCLSKITKITAPLNGTGFRVLTAEGDNLWYPRNKHIKEYDVVKRNKNPIKIPVDGSKGEYYPAGIHVFRTLEGLLGWLGTTDIMFRQIWRADYYELLAQGEQDSVEILVVDNVQYKDLLCV